MSLVLKRIKYKIHTFLYSIFCLKTLENSTPVLQKLWKKTHKKNESILNLKNTSNLLGAYFLLTLDIVVPILLVKGVQISLQGVINTLTKMMHCQTGSNTGSENLDDRQERIRNPISYMKVDGLLFFCSLLQDFSTALQNETI